MSAPKKLFCIESNTTLGGHKGLFERLRKNARSGGKHVFIVPDRYTLGVEKEICESCFPDGTFSVDVFSFTRLAVKSLGVSAANCLSKEGTVLLLHRVVCENNDKLTYYKGIRSVGFARELFAAIASLRSGGITPALISEKLSAFEGNTAQKLKDIALLYEKYTEALSERYVDTVSRVEMLGERLETIPRIAESHIYILGFNIYSDLQMQLIKKMLKVCPSVSVAFCRSPEGGSNARCFPTAQEDALLDWCKENGVGYECVKDDRTLAEPFSTLLLGMFGTDAPKDVLSKEDKEKVRVYSAENPYEEVKCACREMRKLVLDEGYRYKDIAVVCNDDEYLPVLKTVFSRFEIPCFTDEKYSVSRSFVARFVFSVLQAAISGYALADVMECLRSPLSGVTFGERRLFENYCVKYNVSFNKLFEPFAFGDEREEAERVRIKVKALFDKLPKEGALTDDFCDYVLSIARSDEMDKMRESCEKRFREKTQDRKDDASLNSLLAYSDVEPVVTVAEEIKRLCAGQASSPAAFREMLSATLDGMSVSLLPQFVDTVFIGNTSDSRFSDVRAMFVLGATDGNFPVQKGDPLILTGFDSELMAKNGLTVYPLPVEANLLEKFAVIDLCTKPERLYVGYSQTGLSGEKTEKSEGVKEICERLFVKERPLDSYYDFSEEERLLYTMSCRENAYYEYVTGKIPEKYRECVKNYLREDHNVDTTISPCVCNPVEGYGKDDSGYYVSVSILENYFHCPFKHFLSNVLKLQEKEEGEIRANEKGTLIHAVLEDYFRTNVRTLRDAADVDERIEASIKKVFSSKEYERFFLETVSGYEMEQLKKECRRSLAALTENFRHSRFTPRFFELRFGKKEPIKLTVNGKDFYFIGTVDRADTLGDRIVVVDYKTGTVKSDPEKIYDGEKIQLYVYLKYFLDKGYKPAGVFYQPLPSGYQRDGRSYAMKGQMPESLDLYRDFDDRIDFFEGSKYEGKTVFFSLKRSPSSGEIAFSDKKKDLFSEEDLRAVSEYAFRVSEQAISDIQNGDIEKNPVADGCDFCPYAKICGEREERSALAVDKQSFYKGGNDGDPVE